MSEKRHRERGGGAPGFSGAERSGKERKWLV